MQDFNSIDDLFRGKLAKREVAYSASAWAGAEQLLNKHYKWLFLKKLLFTLLPATVISAAGVIYLVSSEPAPLQTLNEQPTAAPMETSVPDSHKEDHTAFVTADPGATQGQQRSIDETYVNVSGYGHSAASQTSVETAEDLPYEPVVTPPSTTARLSAKAQPKGSLNTGPASHDTDQKSVAVNSSPDSHVPIAEDLDALLDDAFTAEMHSGSAAENAATTTHEDAVAYEAASSAFMYGMPKFNVSNIGAGNGPVLSDADRNSGEPLINKLQKLELALDGGGLVARGFLNAGSQRERVSLGAYAGLCVQYHVNQSFYVAGGAGVFTRGSLAGEQVLPGANGTITLDPVSAIYLNIPFKLCYRVSARHSLALGMQYAQLLTVVSGKESSGNGEGGPSREFITDGSGFNSNDIAGVFAYKVSLTERMDGNAEFQYGLFDATDNQFFRTGDISDQNTILRIGVSYRILNR